MSDSFADAAEIPESVTAAAADDEQVGGAPFVDECIHRRPWVDPHVGVELANQVHVDGLAAQGRDDDELRVVSAGEVSGDGSCLQTLRRCVDTGHDALWPRPCPSRA